MCSIGYMILVSVLHGVFDGCGFTVVVVVGVVVVGGVDAVGVSVAGVGDVFVEIFSCRLKLAFKMLNRNRRAVIELINY